MKLSLLALFGATALAASTPHPATRFVDTWQLDLAASDLRMEHPAADYALTRTIAWDGKTLTEADTARNAATFGRKVPVSNATVALLTDGNEHEVEGVSPFGAMMPGKSPAIASWQADNLVIEARGSSPMGAWSTSRRAYLSPDGQRMTEIVTATTGMMDMERRLVFVRAK